MFASSPDGANQRNVSPCGQRALPKPRHRMISGSPKPAAIEGSAAGWPKESEAPKHATPGHQDAHDPLTARDEHTGEHQPRASLEPPRGEEPLQLIGALGTDGEIILDDDRLSVEEKTLGAGRRIIEQLVDERDEPLTKPFDRMVPLAIPVGMGDDVNVERQAEREFDGR